MKKAQKLYESNGDVWIRFTYRGEAIIVRLTLEITECGSAESGPQLDRVWMERDTRFAADGRKLRDADFDRWGRDMSPDGKDPHGYRTYDAYELYSEEVCRAAESLGLDCY